MSEQSTALTVPRQTTPPKDEYEILKHQAVMAVRSGFLPNTVNTPEKALVIALKGRELGVPAMAALSNIAVISGKPVCSAELLASLIYRDHGDNGLRLIESTDERCTYEFKRKGWSQAQRYTFTMDMAKRAKLDQKDVWKQYPDAMLRSRCISAIAKMAFQDTIAGLYTAEELETVMVERMPEVTADEADWSAEVPAGETPGVAVDAETGEILSLEPETLGAEAGNYHVRDLTAPTPDESKREPFAPVGPSTTAQIAKYCALMKREEPDYTSLTQEQGKQLLDQLVADYGAAKKAEVAAESTARAAAAADTSMGQDTAPGLQQQLDELASLTGKDIKDLQKETAIRLSKGGMKVLVPFGKNDGSTRVKIAADLQGQIARAKNEQAVGAS